MMQRKLCLASVLWPEQDICASSTVAAMRHFIMHKERDDELKSWQNARRIFIDVLQLWVQGFSADALHICAELIMSELI